MDTLELMRLQDSIRNRQPLPEDFDQWEIEVGFGTTLAHLAAEYGVLPSNFNRWDITNSCSGDTVAHTAAQYGTLPSNFTQWELTNNMGQTVAHIAAAHGNLPADFERWDIRINEDHIDSDMRATVAFAAALQGYLPESYDGEYAQQLHEVNECYIQNVLGGHRRTAA